MGGPTRNGFVAGKDGPPVDETGGAVKQAAPTVLGHDFHLGSHASPRRRNSEGGIVPDKPETSSKPAPNGSASPRRPTVANPESWSEFLPTDTERVRRPSGLDEPGRSGRPAWRSVVLVLAAAAISFAAVLVVARARPLQRPTQPLVTRALPPPTAVPNVVPPTGAPAGAAQTTGAATPLTQGVSTRTRPVAATGTARMRSGGRRRAKAAPIIVVDPNPPAAPDVPAVPRPTKARIRTVDPDGTMAPRF